MGGDYNEDLRLQGFNLYALVIRCQCFKQLLMQRFNGNRNKFSVRKYCIYFRYFKYRYFYKMQKKHTRMFNEDYTNTPDNYPDH